MSFYYLDDDTLLAYADGALDPARRAEVAALIEGAPELQADLDALRRLQRGLRSAFDAADGLPAPAPASHARSPCRRCHTDPRRSAAGSLAQFLDSL